ncbi:hypothetical protein [Pseudonocardia sp. ICBG1034]|uniref:hypothetical protein n=1 Tax=Pseudonocardia sp. ICBG1034 TaxID=2844381 RepID=UPI001CCB6DDB|nr:hypothetical protein [Pseudonocardia sp. ICBG1034]
METPEYERRGVIEYLESQSGEDFSVDHVEKIATESILGTQYDVWDAHTNEGRWWVITPPTNLYSQDHVRSMDIALSFHIGLMTRMMARDSIDFQPDGSKAWVLEVLRRLETARDSLEQAREIEDVQAVGMRLREVLLTLTAKLRTLRIEIPATVSTPDQDGNFKGWAEVYASALAPGASSARLRKLLRSQSDHAWEYLGWLTHARNASILDGRLAYIITDAVVETFMLAVARTEGEPLARCPECSSYRVARQHEARGTWIQVCSTCNWSGPAEPPRPLDEEYRQIEDSVEESECVTLEDFGIYLTPAQARKALQHSALRAEEANDQPAWSNLFAVSLGEAGSVHDVRRITYSSFVGTSAAGAELTYSCSEENCVNPQHASEMQLPLDFDWLPMIVEEVRVSHGIVHLEAAGRIDGRRALEIEMQALDRFGIADASQLLERVVFVGRRSRDDNDVLVVPGSRRTSLTGGSPIRASFSRVDS